MGNFIHSHNFFRHTKSSKHLLLKLNIWMVRQPWSIFFTPWDPVQQRAVGKFPSFISEIVCLVQENLWKYRVACMTEGYCVSQRQNQYRKKWTYNSIRICTPGCVWSNIQSPKWIFLSNLATRCARATVEKKGTCISTLILAPGHACRNIRYTKWIIPPKATKLAGRQSFWPVSNVIDLLSPQHSLIHS